jgi:hypothetical protein
MKQKHLLRGCLLLGATLLIGCGADEEECSGAVIEASSDALDFGDLAIGGERGIEGDGLVPERRTVFLRNRCSAPLVIERACVVNAGHNGDPASPGFFVEYEPGAEPPLSVKPSKDTAIRVTYDVASVNADLDGDGNPDPDQAVLVIFSNASNGQRLALPVCARAVNSPDVQASGACELPSDFDVNAISETACGS